MQGLAQESYVADLAAATTVAETQLVYVTFLSKFRHKMASPGVTQEAGNFPLLHLSSKPIASSLWHHMLTLQVHSLDSRNK